MNFDGWDLRASVAELLDDDDFADVERFLIDISLTWNVLARMTVGTACPAQRAMDIIRNQAHLVNNQRWAA